MYICRDKVYLYIAMTPTACLKGNMFLWNLTLSLHYPILPHESMPTGQISRYGKTARDLPSGNVSSPKGAGNMALDFRKLVFSEMVN